MSYSSTILATSGLVAYWRLGESSGTNAADSQGTYPGTYSGSPTLGATGLLYSDADKAVTLDGINDQITIPNNAAFGPQAGPAGAISVECWVNMPPLPLYGPLITKFNDALPFEWSLEATDTFDHDGADVGFFCNAGAGNAYAIAHLTYGATHHIVGTFSAVDGHTARIYVDGVPGVTLTAGTADAVADAANVGIGNYDGGTSFTPVTIDEGAIYNVALSPSTIMAHYLLGVQVGLTVPVQGMLDARLMTQGYDQASVAPPPPSSGNPARALTLVGVG